MAPVYYGTEQPTKHSTATPLGYIRTRSSFLGENTDYQAENISRQALRDAFRDIIPAESRLFVFSAAPSQ